MRRLFTSFVVLCVAVTVCADPPKVVKATPDNGATDVDPNLKQIVIEFDQPMDKGGRSIVGAGETFPKSAGAVRWTNDRTIVIPVKLEPGHEYWLSINSDRFTNFKNLKGESAIPYPISFSTAGGEKVTAEIQQKSVDELRKAIDDDYSYRDLRQTNWNKLFADNAKKLQTAETPQAFANVVAAMLAEAKDAHISVRLGSYSFPCYHRNVQRNVNARVLETLIPNFKHVPGSVAATGRFDDGVSYLQINGWPAGDLPAELFVAIEQAKPKAGMIIDVRMNGGGDELSARKVAGCFISKPRIYSKNTTRADGKWLGPFDRVVEPNADHAMYKGKVVVLIGQACMSSNESFILMMKTAGATLIGEKTYGSSGNPKPHELSNGVIVSLPSWNDQLADGSPLEGVGVSPDVEVKTTPADFEKNDPVLDAALKCLRQQK